MACKYLQTIEKIKEKTSQEIIKEYSLTDKEIEILKCLYNKQLLKVDLIDDFYWNWQITKQETSKIFGSLKKKGLIYNVLDFPGYIGTEIKI